MVLNALTLPGVTDAAVLMYLATKGMVKVLLPAGLAPMYH
jgi:hypothetical protein